MKSRVRYGTNPAVWLFIIFMMAMPKYAAAVCSTEERQETLRQGWSLNDVDRSVMPEAR